MFPVTIIIRCYIQLLVVHLQIYILTTKSLTFAQNGKNSGGYHVVITYHITW